jgi:hypothetical protein
VADARAQGSSVRFDNGRVTLDARDVPLRQVLGQWAQVGGVTIVNPDNLPSTIVTLHLVDVPERTALATLLRPVSGYILAARRAGARGPATIDRILILPAGSATRAAAVSGPTPAPGATQALPRPGLTGADLADQDLQDFLNELDDIDDIDDIDDVDDSTDDDSPTAIAVPDGEPLRAATSTRVPTPQVPTEPSPGDVPVPTNPFGIATGSTQPGTVAPTGESQPQRGR